MCWRGCAAPPLLSLLLGLCCGWVSFGLSLAIRNLRNLGISLRSSGSEYVREQAGPRLQRFLGRHERMSYG